MIASALSPRERRRGNRSGIVMNPPGLHAFATQDRWAFAREANHTEEIWKTAGLAGMTRAMFDKAVADTELKAWILKQQQAAQDKWKIDSTPSFVINGTKYTGEMNFDAFRKLIPDA